MLLELRLEAECHLRLELLAEGELPGVEELLGQFRRQLPHLRGDEADIGCRAGRRHQR